MIAVFDAFATDFTTNGLGTIEPISCDVHEVLNGDYDLELVHPIDDTGKYLRLQTGNIIRAPVPRGMTPYVNLPEREIKGDKTSRGVWRLTTPASLYCGPDSIYKKIGGPYPGGTQVSIIATNYTVLDTNRTTGAVERRYMYEYPSGSAPDGYTRVIQIWYRGVVQNGGTGWLAPGTVSNVYHSETIETIVGETVEERQIREQPFRIKSVIPQLDGTIKVYAKHISYDLLENEVIDFESGANDSASDALKALGEATESPHDFSFYCDNADSAAGWKVEGINNPLEAIMGDGGFIETFGGEIARDWFDFFVVSRVGKDKPNIELRQAKNLLSAQYTIDDTNVSTRLTPYGTDSSGKMLMLPEKHVDSPLIDAYPFPRYLKLEVSEAKVGNGVTKAQAQQMLRDACQKAFDSGCDLPVVTLDIDFINLYDTEDYKDFAVVQNLYLGDAVSAVIPRFNLKVVMRMTECTYDCLLKRYKSVSMGSVSPSMCDTTITGRQLASGSVTGRALAASSIGGLQIADGAVSGLKVAEGAIGTAQIVNGAITNAKIGVAAIKTANIENAAITNAHIADAAITKAKIQEGAIGTAQIENGAITNAKIGTAAVDTANIADAAIKSAKIDDAAITRAKIANLAVGAGQIDDLAVTAAKIANAAITNAKIANAAIDTAQIALGAITSALIKNGAIGTAQIADASITEGKVVSLNADVIQSGTLATERLIITGENGLIYEINAETAGLTMTELSKEKYKSQLSGSVLVARSVTAEQIAAATITANEILANTITGDKIAAATITGSNIKAGTLTTSHVSANFGENLDLSSNHSISLRVGPIEQDLDELKENAVASVLVQYALAFSSSTAPTSGWSTDAPAWQDGKFMWQRTITTYADGSSETSSATCLTGATGATGAAGEAGADGEDGVSVSATCRYYLLQSSSLNAPGKPTSKPPAGSWTETEPTYTPGSASTLYFVDLTVFSDGTWSYSAVSCSSAYEAAKAAYNSAAAAQATADDAQEQADAITRTLQRLDGSMNGLATQFNVFSAGIEATIEDHDEILSVMSFDTSGLKIQMGGSIYYTLTDDVGYHIYQNDKEIASFSEGKGKMDRLQMGGIVARKTSKGGWVWIDA